MKNPGSFVVDVVGADCFAVRRVARTWVFTLLAGACWIAGCAIADNRDGIGRSCTSDAACPLDHFCLLDGPVDAGDDAGGGRCAPVLDYGGCDAPTWPVKGGPTLEGDQTVAGTADLVRFDGATAVDGDLFIRREGLPRLVALGDLCGFAGLQRVGGTFVMRTTDATSLDGLQALSSVGGGIVIVDNADLVDVSALANLQFAPPPDDRDAAVLFARNVRLEPASVAALAAVLEPMGIKIFECGNAGALTACPGDVTRVLDPP